MFSLPKLRNRSIEAVFVKHALECFSLAIFFIIKTITEFMKFFFGNAGQVFKIGSVNFQIKIINGNFLFGIVCHHKHRNGSCERTQSISYFFLLGFLYFFNGFRFLLFHLTFYQIVFDSVHQLLFQFVTVFDFGIVVFFGNLLYFFLQLLGGFFGFGSRGFINFLVFSNERCCHFTHFFY